MYTQILHITVDTFIADLTVNAEGGATIWNLHKAGVNINMEDHNPQCHQSLIHCPI